MAQSARASLIRRRARGASRGRVLPIRRRLPTATNQAQETEQSEEYCKMGDSRGSHWRHRNPITIVWTMLTSLAPTNGRQISGSSTHLRFADFFLPEVLRATAARMSALNALASICSPS